MPSINAVQGPKGDGVLTNQVNQLDDALSTLFERINALAADMTAVITAPTVTEGEDAAGRPELDCPMAETLMRLRERAESMTSRIVDLRDRLAV